MKHKVLWIWIFILFAILMYGCSWLNSNEQDEDTEPPPSPHEIYNDDLEGVRDEILFGENGNGDSDQLELDHQIARAVDQLATTLDPAYGPGFFRKLKKRKFFGTYRLGFIEIVDINRDPPSKLHKYISEKVLTFSFLNPRIRESMDLVERFTMKEVRKFFYPYDRPAHVAEKQLVKKLGKLYNLDIIEIGTLTVSPAYYDLNLRMIETTGGRIIAVGTVKIKATSVTQQWLHDFSYPDQTVTDQRQSGGTQQ